MTKIKNRTLSLITAIIMVIGLVGVMPSVSAGAETSGDFEYDLLYDDYIEITGYTGNASQITIPSEINGISVVSIGYEAFYGCDSLVSVTIPSSISSVSFGAFSECSSLTIINVAEDSEYYSSVNGILYNKEQTELIQCPGAITSLTIPDGVTSIGQSSFSYSVNLTSVTIPDSVTSIGDWAFEGCEKLNSIEIPDSVISIGEYAFDETPLITNQTSDIKYVDKWVVQCDAPIETANIKEGTVGIADNTFSFCEYLKNVTIPYGITTIGINAFSYCSSLTSVTIPDSVIRIGDWAFGSCEKLNSIDIPDSVTSIGVYAFDETPLVNNQTSDMKYVGKWLVQCDGQNKTANIKEGTVGIADQTFSFCENLNSVTIPDGVTGIGVGTFAFCVSLKNISIPDSVTSIGESAFVGCYSLESIKIPNSVTSIGEGAFIECSGLKNITIPNSVTSIGNYAFGYIYDYETDGGVTLDGFKIYCYSNTAGEQYAIDNGFDYTLINGEQSIGDLSGDGKITTVDVGIINSFAKGTKDYTDEQLYLADANADGKITTVDVGLINKIAKGV